jgi:ribosomal protein S27AE
MAFMAQPKKMNCPRCGSEMNHHCDKLVYNVSADYAAGIDAPLGGMIEEFHTCPACGESASRPS